VEAPVVVVVTGGAVVGGDVTGGAVAGGEVAGGEVAGGAADVAVAPEPADEVGVAGVVGEPVPVWTAPPADAVAVAPVEPPDVEATGWPAALVVPPVTDPEETDAVVVPAAAEGDDPAWDVASGWPVAPWGWAPLACRREELVD
jgi:hypothetical protein